MDEINVSQGLFKQAFALSEDFLNFNITTDKEHDSFSEKSSCDSSEKSPPNR